MSEREPILSREFWLRESETGRSAIWSGSARMNSCPETIHRLGAETIGYLFGFARLTNTCKLALIGARNAGVH